jgi:hypothetical protein
VGRPSLFDTPVVWFGIQVLEYLVIIPALLRWMPPTWARDLQIAVYALVAAAVVAINYLILRWLHRTRAGRP